MYRRPNVAPDNPTVVVVGGGSPPNTNEDSEPDSTDTTRSEERQEAIQLGVAMERLRQAEEGRTQDRLRIESLETSNQEIRALNLTLNEKVDALLTAVQEPQANPQDVLPVTPIAEPEPDPEPEPIRESWWDKVCNKLNGM